MTAHADHWNRVHAARDPSKASWFQVAPTVSLELITGARVPLDAPILDVGAGSSNLVDALLGRGFRDVTLLDIAGVALDTTLARLGPRAASVKTLVTDVTELRPTRRYRVWHDRAVFHFLTEPERRAAYVRALADALEPGGAAIIATFALDGPTKCSGLPVQRYSAETLADELAGVLELTESRREMHATPAGAVQSFVFASFRRR
jgi:2-polyprenyl-3-methyl-5-hydroxy-6-metoxy-1,4-benzoquinol methylase